MKEDIIENYQYQKGTYSAAGCWVHFYIPQGTGRDIVARLKRECRARWDVARFSHETIRAGYSFKSI